MNGNPKVSDFIGGSPNYDAVRFERAGICSLLQIKSFPLCWLRHQPGRAIKQVEPSDD